MFPHEDPDTTTADTAAARSKRWLVGGLLAAGALVGIGTAAALAGDDGTEAMRAAPPTIETTIETTNRDDGARRPHARRPRAHP